MGSRHPWPIAGRRGQVSLLDAAPCGFVLTDKAGRILWSNRFFDDWRGRPEWNHLRENNFRDFLTPGGKIFFDTHISPLLALQGHVNEIALDLVFDGRCVPALVNFREDAVDDGSPPQWLISLFEATDRRKYEQTLLRVSRELEAANKALERRAEEMREMADELTKARDEVIRASANRGAYFASLSHELRTPLNAVIGYASLIASDLGDSAPREKIRRFGSHIESAGLHLLTLINDILDFSQINTYGTKLNPDIIMVDDAIDRAVSLLRPRFIERRQVLVIEPPPTRVQLWADPVRLHQILLNVISNAGKYTPEQGRIRIDWKIEDDLRVKIRVSDTGIGIPPEEVGRVFEPFVRGSNTTGASSDGTGLGLPMTQRLVELMGGVISLSSTLGVGTTVEIRLPSQAASDPHRAPRLNA